MYDTRQQKYTRATRKIVNIKINGRIIWPNSLNSVNIVTQTTLQTPKNQEQRVATETARRFDWSCCVTLLTVEGKESADMVFFSQLQSALMETEKSHGIWPGPRHWTTGPPSHHMTITYCQGTREGFMGNVVFISIYGINLNRTAIIRMCFVSKYLTSKCLHWINHFIKTCPETHPSVCILLSQIWTPISGNNSVKCCGKVNTLLSASYIKVITRLK